MIAFSAEQRIGGRPYKLGTKLCLHKAIMFNNCFGCPIVFQSFGDSDNQL